MGVIEDWHDLEKIGSVRSCRDYYVSFALEFDAIYVHFGQATVYVGDMLNSDAVDNISGAVAGIDRPANNAFYRTDDRKAPHNVYVSAATNSYCFTILQIVRTLRSFPPTYFDIK